MLTDRKKTIAVAIDYQERLVPAIYNREELIKKSCILLEGLKLLEVPIYITQQYTHGLGMTVSEITNAAGTKDYIEKISFGATEELVKVIPPAAEKPNVIVFGIESHICVLQTLLGLKEEGYKPILVADCISSRKKSDYDIALERAGQEGILLTTYESILFELLNRAGSDTFKQISKLVK